VKKYILKNISNYDIHLSDLGYVIPAKSSRNLFGKNARLDREQIRISRENGSISKRLGTSLIEIAEEIYPKVPLKKLAVPSEVDNGLAKSCLKVKEEELSSDIQETVLSEEDELLKRLEMQFDTNVSPVVNNEDEK
jgi:hypothetical protein